MASKDPVSMNKPVPFIETDEEGSKMTVNEEALSLLRDVTPPVSVISIVGKYRTGKSYLLNRFYNTNSGFSLGSTIQAMTKGIWIWVRPHPVHRGGSLVLLDTEGLHDVEKGDKTHDMKLFSLALLLSNCLLYNATGTLDDVIIQELHLVSELAQHIRTQEGEEEDGLQFSKFFPNFFLVLRDFFLKLEIGGKPCTPDEYLSNALKLKKGIGATVNAYNTPRECIRAYFPSLKCLVMCKPVNDDGKLRDLDRVKEEEINPEFLRAAKDVIDEVMAKAEPLQVSGRQISGSGFGELACEYVEHFNKGGIPCISTAVDNLRENECNRALEDTIKLFKKSMGERLDGKLPVTVDELTMTHRVTQSQCMEYFKGRAVFDNDGHFVGKLVEQMKDAFLEIIKSNDESSRAKCQKLLQHYFKEIDEGIKSSQYIGNGAYSRYKDDRDAAVKDYNNEPRKGPLADEVLKEFLEARRSQEHAIINADKALEEKEKELAMESEMRKGQEEKAKAAAAEQKRMMQTMIAEQQSHQEVLKTIQDDFEKQQKQQAEEYKRDLEKKEQDHKMMVEQGMMKQAEQYKEMIQEMKEDRKRKDQEMNMQVKEMKQMQANQSEVLREMMEQRKTSERATVQMIQQMERSRIEQQKQAEVRQERDEKRREQQMELQRQQMKEDRVKFDKQMEQQKKDSESKLEQMRKESNEKIEELKKQKQNTTVQGGSTTVVAGHPHPYYYGWPYRRSWYWY